MRYYHPSSIYSLSSLDLSHNQLTGSIPPELGKVHNLSRLDLSFNQLTGSIPPELGNVLNHDYDLGGHNVFMDLSHNRLTGSIPPELASNIRAASLDLSDNRLTGSIPPELGAFAVGSRINDAKDNFYLHPTGLDLSFNQLTGSIPPELILQPHESPCPEDYTPGLCLYNAHQNLDLSHNQLTGSIPPELGAWETRLPTFSILNLSCNRLTGSIPLKLRTLVGRIISDNHWPRLRGNELTGPAHYELLKSSCLFDDIEGSVHKANIERIRRWRISIGCGTAPSDRFCPSQTVNRRQMATFLYRVLVEPSTVGIVYDDDPQQWAVERGIIRAPGGNFNPGGAVTRADMAEMLVAAFPSLSAAARSQGLFTDTTGLPDATVRAIEGIHAAGVTTGCATEPLRYCPHKKITRAQMATFLARAISPALRR